MNSVTRTKELNPKFIACENSIKTVNSTLYMNYESLINELRMIEMKIKTGENYFTSNNKQLNIAELLDLQDKTMSLLFEQYNNVKQKLNDNSVDIRLLREMYDLLKSGGIINPLSLKTVGGGHVCTPEVLVATTTKECTISISVNSLNFYSSVELNFHMHYFVTGANWIPSYDFTINSKGKKYFLDVDTFGIVKQSTGEDWLDTVLILGTSQEEYLYPLNYPTRKSINIQVPNMRESRTYSRTSGNAKYGQVIMLTSASALTADAAEFNPKLSSIQERSSDVYDYGKSDVAFVIDHKVNISSSKATDIHAGDAENMRIFIHESSMDVEVFSYVIPSQNTDVYYQVMGKFISQIPYIPQTSTRLYWDGAYIGKVNPDAMYPNDNFIIPLGKNKNCDVTYYAKIPQNSKDNEEKTVWMTLVGDTKSKYKVKTEEYVFSIKHKSKEGSSDTGKHLYLLSENIPISSNTDIKMELIKPAEKVESIDEHSVYTSEKNLLQGIVTNALADASHSNKIYHYKPSGNLYYVIWLSEGESYTGSIKYSVLWPSEKNIEEYFN